MNLRRRVGAQTVALARRRERELGPATVILCRSRDFAHRGGKAIGAYILRRRRAGDLMLCSCCTCVIDAGAVIYDCWSVTGEALVVCADCVGPT
jgi:hypothetical protein